MNINIGQVFSTTFAMMKERWAPLLGLWATFFVALILYFIVFGAFLGGSSFLLAGGLEDAGALAGLGAGFILMAIVFYIGYLVLAFGQQGSMVAMASPLQRINFGEAFTVGLRGGLSFIGVVVLLMIAYFALALVAGLLVAAMGEAGAIVLGLIFVPVMIYLVCRLSVLMPVIVVEGVFNPITAIKKAWGMTSGKVLGIFLIYLILIVIVIVAIVLPFGLIFGFSFADLESGEGPGVGSAIFAFVYFVAVFFGFTLLSTALSASIHSEVSDTQVEELSDTFQ